MFLQSTVIGKFTVCKLKTATGHLSVENVIGMGGYGVVYKGTLESGQSTNLQISRTICSILLLLTASSITKFKNEVEILRTLRHPNLVKLYGYASEGNEKFLVHEFMPGEELPKASTISIAAPARPSSIHRDIKSSNILLDNQLQAKLADFGLARYEPPKVLDKSHVTTRVLGSQGYCAPEYLDSGKLTFKCDI
ncbi:unnamed protein product [Coffea canephora]|uniref:Protein kinase domain-containing protein n=1 Tax=Coffea canephora TaxID=49390 RepID=A0A068UU98_COFCA|nr:unnamed protein product [Coffea canephora]